MIDRFCSICKKSVANEPTGFMDGVDVLCENCFTAMRRGRASMLDLANTQGRENRLLAKIADRNAFWVVLGVWISAVATSAIALHYWKSELSMLLCKLSTLFS